ncbi:MAG TPA: hypothetical protein VFW19_10570 [Allosphingosinicella sp.]|nr:hypothetical protein [Allosphingosinicella sp.]
MDFATAWSTFAIGAQVTVSNGLPPPSDKTDGLPYMAWRSHNFTGTLTAKLNGAFRQMSFNLAADENGNIIGYVVAEAVTHTFTAA